MSPPSAAGAQIKAKEEKAYAFLKTASDDELIAFAAAELSSSPGFEAYRQNVEKALTAVRVELVRQDAIQLLTQIGRTVDGYDAIISAYAEVLLQGHPLNEVASKDLGQRLSGQIKRPRRKPGAKPDAWRGHAICRVLSILRDYAGRKPSRNEATDTICGADIVSEATRRTDMRSFSYRAIIEIWRRKGNSLRGA